MPGFTRALLRRLRVGSVVEASFSADPICFMKVSVQEAETGLVSKLQASTLAMVVSVASLGEESSPQFSR